jgi:hypothetical protein
MPGRLSSTTRFVALVDRESHLPLLSRFSARYGARNVMVASTMPSVLEAAARAHFTPTPIQLDDDLRKVVSKKLANAVDRIRLESRDAAADRFLDDFVRQVLTNDEMIMGRSPLLFEELFTRHNADAVVTVNRLYRSFRRHLSGFVLAARELGLLQVDLVAGGGPGWSAPALPPEAAADRFLAADKAVCDELNRFGIPPNLIELLPDDFEIEQPGS